MMIEADEATRPGWRVVLTHARYECRVAEVLTARRVDVYVPREPRWRGREEGYVLRPIFPGMVFARVPAGAFGSVVRIYGVRGFLRVSGEIGTVPAGDLQRLQVAEMVTPMLLELGAFLRWARARDRKRVLAGPFVSLGSVDGQARLKWLLQRMGAGVGEQARASLDAAA